MSDEIKTLDPNPHHEFTKLAAFVGDRTFLVKLFQLEIEEALDQMEKLRAQVTKKQEPAAPESA